MYIKYSEIYKWKSEIMDMSATDHDGVKEVIINISGKDVFGKLKFESGTHRVQRVLKPSQEEEYIHQLLQLLFCLRYLI